MKTNPNNLDTNTHKEIIQNLIEKLSTYYIFPEVAEAICSHLQKNLVEVAYSDITEGEFLAFALTTHIQGINQVKHLWVRWYPDPLPEHEGSLLKNQEKVAEWKHRGKLDNFGIHKVERLPGNVGYIDIHYFYRTSWGSGDTIVAAMNFLANTDCVIIDLRKCMGGNPSAVAFTCSYFFDEEPIHLNSLYWRENDVTEQYWTLPHVPGKRMVQQPVFILTSKGTFSGGEEFAYNLQTQKRGTLIGEATGGGAHPGSPYRIHPHFEVFIPNGRAINPITHQNWEGNGVQPDIPVPADQALQTAYQKSLYIVIEKLHEPTTRPQKQLLAEAQTALQNIDDL